MTDDILGLCQWPMENHCDVVAMESTGVYWKPVYNLLEERGFKQIVRNAQCVTA